MKSQNIINTIFEIEKQYDLFNKEIDGVYFWKRCRFAAYLDISSKHSQISDYPTQLSKNGLISKLNLVARSLLDYPFKKRNSDIMVMASARYFFDPVSKKYRDIYTDPIVKQLSSTVIFQELSMVNTARLPKPYPVKYLNYVSLSGLIARKIGSRRLKASDLLYLEKLDAIFMEAFNVKCNIVDQAEKAVYASKDQIPIFRHLIRRILPKLALIVCSYGKENFIEACHEEGVPVVELQHGTITPNHLGYIMPPYKNVQKLFPDYLMVFGQFWKDINHFPISEENVLVTGFPFFESEKKRLKLSKKKKKQIMFISQPTIGAKLSQIAAETAELLPKEWSVVYRLHPSEFEDWERHYSLFVRSKVKVETGKKSLYELINESFWLIGVCSTAIFEGLGLGSRVILVDLPGIENMSFLTESKYGLVADKAENIVEIIQSKYREIKAINRDYFFEADAECNVVSMIRGLINEHS